MKRCCNVCTVSQRRLISLITPSECCGWALNDKSSSRNHPGPSSQPWHSQGQKKSSIFRHEAKPFNEISVGSRVTEVRTQLREVFPKWRTRNSHNGPRRREAQDLLISSAKHHKVQGHPCARRRGTRTRNRGLRRAARRCKARAFAGLDGSFCSFKKVARLIKYVRRWMSSQLVTSLGLQTVLAVRGYSQNGCYKLSRYFAASRLSLILSSQEMQGVAQRCIPSS